MVWKPFVSSNCDNTGEKAERENHNLFITSHYLVPFIPQTDFLRIHQCFQLPCSDIVVQALITRPVGFEWTCRLMLTWQRKNLCYRNIPINAVTPFFFAAVKPLALVYPGTCAFRPDTLNTDHAWATGMQQHAIQYYFVSKPQE